MSDDIETSATVLKNKTQSDQKKSEAINTANPAVVEKLSDFETRWRYAVFPAMLAFMVLACFGFYLIFSMQSSMKIMRDSMIELTGFMSDMKKDMRTMTIVMNDTLPVMRDSIVGMNQVMTISMPDIHHQVKAMSNHMESMSYSTHSMAVTTDFMGRNLWDLNRNVSKPMNLFRRMIPGGSGTSVGAPPSSTYPHYQYQQPFPNQFIPTNMPVPIPLESVPEPEKKQTEKAPPQSALTFPMSSVTTFDYQQRSDSLSLAKN